MDDGIRGLHFSRLDAKRSAFCVGRTYKIEAIAIRGAFEKVSRIHWSRRPEEHH
jgi:hypothetical protein